MANEKRQQMIPVYCTAHLSEEVINDFLEKAYDASPDSYQLCLITTKDVGTLQKASNPPISPFENPFLDHFSGVCGGFVSEYTSSNSQLSDKAFVYLDAQTAKDKRTCIVVGAEDTCVRTVFNFCLVAITNLLDESRNWLQLQNDAAIAGGALQEFKLNENQPITATGKRLVEELESKSSKSWQMSDSGGNQKLIPVFCTAKVPLEILNEFLSSTYAEHRAVVEEDGVGSGYLRLVTDPSPSTQSSPTKPPITTAIESFPFISLSAQTLSAFTKLRYGGDSPLGNMSFIILDELTACGDQTCIIASNDAEEEQGVQLVRCDLRNALSITYAIAAEVMPMREYADEAAMKHDGVYRA